LVYERSLQLVGSRFERLGFVRAACVVLTVSCAASCAHTRPRDTAAYIPTGWPSNDPARQIMSAYGPRNGRLHAGIDIDARRKSPVVSTAYGTVEDTGRDRGGYGKYVLINHGNGFETLYAHLAWIKTKRGKYVERGDRIGKVGKTGNSTGYHIHYEIRRDGKAINPAPYMGR
jgi:murein DD-endopeptidase MepM/ murein hydrolase activator NlpD